MLQRLMGVTIQYFPQTLRFRFVGWGKDVEKYFETKDPKVLNQLIKLASEDINMLRQQMKGGRVDVVLDFRE